MASGSNIAQVRIKGTFGSLARSRSRTGMLTTAAGRRRAKNNAARRNAQQIRRKLQEF